jgi:hypothetical protein
MDIPAIYTPNMASLSQIGRYFCWYREHKSQIPEVFASVPYSYMFFHTPVLPHNDFTMKKKRMSMVVSGKNFAPAQSKRLDLLRALLQTDLQIDFYGRNLAPGADPRIKGSIPFMQKQLALEEYQYSICIENMVYNGWITEKFFDCVINNCVPLTNSPTALTNFDQKSFGYLNFDYSIEQLVATIRDIYNNDDFEQRKDAIIAAKKLVVETKFSICEKIYTEFNQ